MSTVTVTENLREGLAKLAERLTPRRVAFIAGQALLEQRKSHLIAYGQAHPGRMGPTTGFYSRAADATSMSVGNYSATITTNHIGLNQRIYGGLISPVKGKYLTIPVDEQARGRNASSMDLVPVIRVIGGKARVVALALPDTKQKPGKRMFVMKESVKQIGDPEVIPSEAQIMSAVNAAMEDKF